MTQQVENNNLQEVAGKIAIGATGVALLSGIIAIGAAALSDQKTRNKIASDSKTVFENLRHVIHFLKKEGRHTFNSIKEISD